MKLVRLTADLIRVDGGVMRRGSILAVVREYRVNCEHGRRQRRLALADESGKVLLPCVRPEMVGEIR